MNIPSIPVMIINNGANHLLRSFPLRSSLLFQERVPSSTDSHLSRNVHNSKDNKRVYLLRTSRKSFPKDNPPPPYLSKHFQRLSRSRVENTVFLSLFLRTPSHLRCVYSTVSNIVYDITVWDLGDLPRTSTPSLSPLIYGHKHDPPPNL